MDDLEFVQRCLRQDKTAWNEFLTRYSRLIYNYIYSILNSGGYLSLGQHANDIFQEVITTLIKDDYRKLRSFQARNGCSLASWLRQVTINLTIDYLRRIKPAVSIDQEDMEGFSLKYALKDESGGVAEKIEGAERYNALKECIERLSDSEKFFLELHFHRGLRLGDLKGILKLSRGAIDMQKSRLLDRLRDCFRSKGFALDL
jgi:RNA polymerase sigma factor (sigma-70 family)